MHTHCSYTCGELTGQLHYMRKALGSSSGKIRINLPSLHRVSTWSGQQQEWLGQSSSVEMELATGVEREVESSKM